MQNSSRCFIPVLFLYSIILSANAGLIEHVSVSSNGTGGNDVSLNPALSADGQTVVFVSAASNLVEGDINGEADIFAHDRMTGLTEIVSLSSNGVQGNDSADIPSVSADGRFVVFTSNASNLVDGDTNGERDIFVRDRQSSLTQRVSLSSLGVQANDDSGNPSISDDGRFVAFTSAASNLVDDDINDKLDVFVHDRMTGLTEVASISSSGAIANANAFLPKLSANGRFVVFSSRASNLVNGDINTNGDIFVHDRQTRLTELASVSSTGMRGNGNSFYPSISANGQFVMFTSTASNLVDGDVNDSEDAFVHDRNSGLTEIVSKSSSGEQGNGDLNQNFIESTISAGGRFVTYASAASNLVDGDNNGDTDIFVHDRMKGLTELLSVSSTGVQANNFSIDPAISADGRFVAFFSFATNLVDGNTNNAAYILIAENTLSNNVDDLTVTLDPTSGSTQVGNYYRIRARFRNNSNTTLTNCNARIINPLINWQREFSFYSWPLKVANPTLNGAIDIAAGETGQINLAILPRVSMRREVRFEYECDTTKALVIPFVNSVHLTAKTEPLISEDFVQLNNRNSKVKLEIDRSNGKYWTPYAVEVSNTGNQTVSVNLTTTSSFSNTILRQSQLCEPINPANSNWSCSTPRNTQLQVDLSSGETKLILVFVHARQLIDEKPVINRIYVEARDRAGDIVATTSMGISTKN